MNFETYSKKQFESLGLNTPDARKLADQLQADVNEVVHEAVLPAFSNVIKRLNAEGHNLTNYDDIRAGAISFRDEPTEGQCHLRLVCDVVISAGYANAITLSEQARDSISNKLETLWDRYIDALHRFITLNTSLIVGLAGFVSFLPKLHGAGDTSTLLESKGFLFSGLVLLMLSLICVVSVRIWAQIFMEYEILQPKADVDKYFKGRVHFTKSYRLNPSSYVWQSVLVRFLTIFAALCFLVGLSLSLFFLYRNLP